MKLALLLLAALVTACAMQGEMIGGYWWISDPTAPKCQAVLWKQVSPTRIAGLCGTFDRAASAGTSCALGCVVVSPYSAEQAKHISLFGESLYQHEARHVLDGKVHP